MITQINLHRKSAKFDKKLTSYRMQLSIPQTENIPTELFIMQRVRNAQKETYEDQFVAICTPVQMADLDVKSPAANSSYYRTNCIELIGRTPEYLEEVFNQIVSDLQVLSGDVNVLNTELSDDGIYEITSDNVEITMSSNHTHYRQLLIAAPAGFNEVFTVNDLKYHRVATQDTNRLGWLNTDDNDLSDYAFKYNIAKDPILSTLFPLPTDKVHLAKLEVNGIVTYDARILENCILWKANAFGFAPWPANYGLNQNQDVDDQLRIVLDFIR